jgi:hypothetical protein
LLPILTAGISGNMPFYQVKLELCRFVTTKLSPLVEYASKSNAAVTQVDSKFLQTSQSQLPSHSPLSSNVVLELMKKKNSTTRTIRGKQNSYRIKICWILLNETLSIVC